MSVGSTDVTPARSTPRSTRSARSDVRSALEKSTPQPPFSCRSMRPGARMAPPQSTTRSQARAASSAASQKRREASITQPSRTQRSSRSTGASRRGPPPPRLLLLAVVVLAWGWGIGIVQTAARGGKARRVMLWGCVAQLAVLGYFKYANFFSENLRSALSAAGWESGWTTLNIILPAGPIIRPHLFLPQLKSERVFDAALFWEGSRKFVIGFLYKAVFADNIAAAINPIWGGLEKKLGYGNTWCLCGVLWLDLF